MRELNEAQMIQELRLACRRAGSQSQWAGAHGFSPQFVTDVLKGRREVSRRLAEVLGYNKEVVFRAQEGGDA